MATEQLLIEVGEWYWGATCPECGEQLPELQQKHHSLAGVVAVAPKAVNDLQLAGNVALAFLNVALGLCQVFLENHRFHRPPIADAPARANSPGGSEF